LTTTDRQRQLLPISLLGVFWYICAAHTSG
jgi:hypothetical protein